MAYWNIKSELNVHTNLWQVSFSIPAKTDGDEDVYYITYQNGNYNVAAKTRRTNIWWFILPEVFISKRYIPR
jgi:hypothetical protein